MRLDPRMTVTSKQTKQKQKTDTAEDKKTEDCIAKSEQRMLWDSSDHRWDSSDHRWDSSDHRCRNINKTRDVIQRGIFSQRNNRGTSSEIEMELNKPERQKSNRENSWR